MSSRVNRRGGQAEFEIDGCRIGGDARCFVIAEAGVNHGGSLDQALELVEAAASAGADAVKFQTFRADRLATQAARQAPYQTKNLGADGSQREMLRALELDEAAHVALMQRCRERGILFLSSPFDEGSADLLARLGVAAFKTGSGELTNTPFLAHIARKGLPMIVSTGMADMTDVDRAVAAIVGAGSPPLALLHCVSDYPARPEHANLNAMATLGERFRVPVGFSDHTPGSAVAIAAVALGAVILEKHLTLDRNQSGPDHAASLEPDELAGLVGALRAAESALGSEEKRPWPHELLLAEAARKSLVAGRDIAAGETVTREDLVAKRPGSGIAPHRIDELVGRRTLRAIARETPIELEWLS